MAKKLVTAYSDTLLKIGEVNTWLKVSADVDENELVTSLIKTAISTIENICNISIFSQVWENYFDDFPNSDVRTKLYPANVSSITSIKYNDEDSAQQTLSTNIYTSDLVTQPASVILKIDQEYPTTDLQRNNVIIRFSAGWATWVLIPDILKTAIKMTVTHWYENRQPVVIGRMVSEIPMTVKYLLQNSGYLIKEF